MSLWTTAFKPAFRPVFRPALINIGLQWVQDKVEVAKK